uniref:Isoform 2 of Sodium-dependent organic anion transporter n=1 Tax=Bos taurus TaxID=9913 RepID=A6QP84-2|nr:sodium-dependent organic anion transporter variant 2 [Bos taurus]
MRANCSSGLACPANSSEEELPEGLKAFGNLDLVFTVVSALMIGLLMFSLGCSVEVQKLWGHIRRPWGIAVGMLCQFGLMPLIAYLLIISFSLKPLQAIAVLIMGCCPGGTVSNIFTFWVDGDMDLSISMTTCSTMAALGMMPLCLYLYTLSWNLEQNLTIPYQNIGITLVCLIIPVAFGIYVNYRWPKQSKIILKVQDNFLRNWNSECSDVLHHAAVILHCRATGPDIWLRIGLWTFPDAEWVFHGCCI